MKIRLLVALLVWPMLAGAGTPQEDAKLLQRLYDIRSRMELEQARAENEARANVRLQVAAQPQTDNPTVTSMRQDMAYQLAQFENNFRCLDVDVNNDGGNTVVICGDNDGDISGSNVSAGRDINAGGAP